MLHSTKIGDHHFLSFKLEEWDKEDHCIVLYKIIDNDTIAVFMMDTDSIVADIEKGDLKGSVNNSLLLKEAIITANPKELREYLEKRGRKCFEHEPMFKLKRVRR